LPLGLFKGAPGQNLPDRAHLVSPSRLHPWPWFLIIPGRKVGKLWRLLRQTYWPGSGEGADRLINGVSHHGVANPRPILSTGAPVASGPPPSPVLSMVSRRHFIIGNRLSNTPLPLPHPSPFHLAMPHRLPSTLAPPAAWHLGRPAPKTRIPKPGDWDSYPPGLYIGLRQDS
jgi:hypothetical protein